MTKLTEGLAPTTFTTEVTLPKRILLRNVAGKPIYLEVDKLPASVIAAVFEGGAKVILTNAFNGGGKDRPEAERLAQMQKRMDAWARGEYVVVERESAYGAMREAYIDETKARTNASVKDIEAGMAKAVKDAFGKDEKVTFGRFLDAIALVLASAKNGSPAEVREKLEAKYARLADEAAAKRKETSAALDVSGISLD